jgi:hypothetical protein
MEESVDIHAPLAGEVEMTFLHVALLAKRTPACGHATRPNCPDERVFEAGEVFILTWLR